jgi:DNA-binding NtrC family response regulator
VLIVMPGEHGHDIQRHLNECGVEVFVAPSCAEARKVLSLRYQIAAVFTSLVLPDGDFRQIVEIAGARSNPAPVIVCLSEMDAGWVDLLEAGAAGVLREGCDLAEIRRVVDEVIGTGSLSAVPG